MNLELFACSGGMAEGFRRAGIRFDLVFDFDPDACASYRANLGHDPVRMDVHDLLRLVRAGWRPPEEVELLVADPPCTPWSRAGKRQGLEDERDMLEETAELIRLLRPREYLIGNVPGLQDASSWGVVQTVIGGLARFGYCVDDYVSLDAADYGVPQHRVRPFWYGHRGGECVRWPARTHCDPEELLQAHLPGVATLPPWVTCREALQDLPVEELGRPVRLRWTDADRKNGSRLSGHVTVGTEETAPTITRRSEYALARTTGHPTAKAEEPAPTIRGGGAGHSAPHVVMETEGSRLVGRWPSGGKHLPSEADRPALTVTAAGPSSASNVLLCNPRHPVNVADEPSMTLCAKDRGGAQGARVLATPTRPPQGHRVGDADEPADTLTATGARVGQGSAVTLGWPWDRPSTTIQQDERIPPPGHKDEHRRTKDGGRGRSTANAIVLSERAAKRLQGFPDAWVFVGKTKRSRWAQLGMAMPPPLAEVVARAIAARRRSP